MVAVGLCNLDRMCEPPCLSNVRLVQEKLLVPTKAVPPLKAHSPMQNGHHPPPSVPSHPLPPAPESDVESAGFASPRCHPCNLTFCQPIYGTVLCQRVPMAAAGAHNTICAKGHRIANNSFEQGHWLPVATH